MILILPYELKSKLLLIDFAYMESLHLIYSIEL